MSLDYLRSSKVPQQEQPKEKPNVQEPVKEEQPVQQSVNEVINLEKEIKEQKPIKRSFYIRASPMVLKLVGFLLLASPIVMGFGVYNYVGNQYGMLSYALIGSMCYAVAMLLLIIYLSKKTHAILELKSIMTGNPLSLFFTDNKRVIWKSIKPENEMIQDKEFGTFLANKDGNYIDTKTKNILMAFNTPLGTNASTQCYTLADGMAKVYKDEKIMNNYRKLLTVGQLDDDSITYNGVKYMTDFVKLRESINFSHLKSLLNSITPHHTSAAIEMKVAQRISSFGNVNVKQLLMIFLAVLGAGGLLYMVIMSVQNGNTAPAVGAVKGAAMTIGG